MPSFKICTINIGDRQRGRIKADSVIDCDTSVESIQSSLNKLFSPLFQEQLQQIKNPYGNGGASKKIVEIIRIFSLDRVLKKRFYNINF